MYLVPIGQHVLQLFVVGGSANRSKKGQNVFLVPLFVATTNTFFGQRHVTVPPGVYPTPEPAYVGQMCLNGPHICSLFVTGNNNAFNVACRLRRLVLR